MKSSISNKTMLSTLALATLVLASLYDLNLESSALSSRDDKGAEIIDNETGRKEQVDTPPDNDKEIAMLVQSNHAHLMEHDLAP